ncbi:haloacid dehalogenase-like hydrolase [Calothrix sp. PCC 6303]|uniref:haloacid dehalogenase-like hydrolase n=1 Tax=Calothrix sp. PCC 6303 TaxID=1170562 RepID=UPI0002A02097|nr:haloacid dehalogenase-like hydrolase [Calothrix sp. PCC 6303]AFZ04121.1 hypothetical protein Cal6303_5235 [Calothrix sp. PCC 6303]
MSIKQLDNTFKLEKLSESSATEVVSFFKNKSEKSLIILDFDETLLLRNSTEEYLNIIQPRPIAAILLIILDAVKPWRFLPKKIATETSRDWIRVLLVTIIFPWNILLWRSHAQKLAETSINTELIEAINIHKNHRIVVATKGFNFIVRPIIQHLNTTIDEIIGCRFWMGCVDRNQNKEDLIASKISCTEIRESIVVTDSLDDASLLAIVKHPFLVIWSQAKYIAAMQDAYVPFFYLEKVKRPGKRSIQEIILKNHLISLILALSWISPTPILHIPGITLLVFAFWCIYEVGYHENDQVAEKFEKNPVLSATYHKYKSKMNQWEPWIWAVTLSFLGIVLIEASQTDIWKSDNRGILGLLTTEHITEVFIKLFLWLGVLALTRLTYVAYNYLDEKTRIWIYPILQVWKFFGFLVISASNSIGVALLLAQLFVEWIPYSIYRCGGNRQTFQPEIFRLFVYSFLCLTIAIGMGDASILINYQFVIIFVWVFLRSKSEMMTLLSNASLLGQQSSEVEIEANIKL